MKLVTFQYIARQSIGVLLDDAMLIDLNSAYAHRSSAGSKNTASLLAYDMKDFLFRGPEGLAIASELIAEVQQRMHRQAQESLPVGVYPLRDVRLMAPLSNPQKIVAIGQNYQDHCAEQGVTPPEKPIIFAKFPTSIIGPHDPIMWDPDLTAEVDYEAELAVVIGQTARNVAQEEALEYVAGYMNANDVSARDLQFGDRQWVRGKSLDTFCPIGPYLLTKDEVPDPHTLAIRSILNDRIMQDSNTRNLIFSVPFLIAYASRAFTLLPGDILLTGTPSGVGVFRTPKVLLKPGDTITIEVERLGTLTNPIGAWKK